MKIHESWHNILKEEIKKEYYKQLINFLDNEINNGKIIYPKKENWFNALSFPINNIKVVILGQDPYHGENQANGFSFSVHKGIKQPPSLKNIFLEIENEFKYNMSKTNGDLLPWAEQGVVLLNSVLSVEHAQPASHKNKGWEIFTDKIIEEISFNLENVVFILWGNYAIQKSKLIDKEKHLILTSPHPSPLSAYTGFWGNNHFIKTNNYLKNHNKNEIIWQITD